MNSESVTYNLPRCYLEGARVSSGLSMTRLAATVFEKQFGDAPINNAIFAVVSVCVVFSFCFAMANLFRCVCQKTGDAL